jgi:hypothetical protein
VHAGPAFELSNEGNDTQPETGKLANKQAECNFMHQSGNTGWINL